MDKKSISTPLRIWIRDAAEQLANVGISTALLDAEIILTHTIRRSRTYIHAYDDEELTERQLEIANARLELRLDRTPIAYIIGHKEFYGRVFHVTPSVLIPRPESETIIDLLAHYYQPTTMKRLLDLGTGSGCLGVTAKLEHPELDVTVSDTSKHALSVAQKNANALDANIHFIRSDMFQSPELRTRRFDIILANLPYVDEAWERSPETNYEPVEALFAANNGLAVIMKCIKQLPLVLTPGGIAVLEADPEQHHEIIEACKQRGLSHLESRDYCVAFRASDT